MKKCKEDYIIVSKSIHNYREAIAGEEKGQGDFVATSCKYSSSSQTGGIFV